MVVPMTTIAWCDETWNPLLGCSRQGPGCDNCYAMLFMHRNLRPEHRGLTIVRASGPHAGVDWSGEVRTLPERLGLPFTIAKPSRIFTTSASDPFHQRVPFPFVAAILGVIAATPEHTHLMLTKQPKRALAFFRWYEGSSGAGASPLAALHHARTFLANDPIARARIDEAIDALDDDDTRTWGAWPIPNLHLGVSVEDQHHAEERIPALLECPNALPWVSAEPLLSRVNLAPWLSSLPTRAEIEGKLGYIARGLRWVVVGGESGRRARRYCTDWAEDLIAQCRSRGVAIFHKQLGAKPEALDYPGGYLPLKLADKKGETPSEWPPHLDVRQWPTLLPAAR